MSALYYVLSSIEKVDALFPNLANTLTPQSAAYVSTYKRQEDRRGRQSVRILAKLLLSFLSRSGEFRRPAEFSISKYDSGAVYSPQSDLHLSFSHTRTHVAVAISEKSCGIDIESATREVDREMIAKRFFSKDEYRRVKSDDASFFKIWTAKEAFLKMEKTGINRPLNTLCVDENNRLISHEKVEFCVFTSSKKIDNQTLIFSIVEGEDCQEIAISALKA